jgi:ABC-2 type transport system permease protein
MRNVIQQTIKTALRARYLQLFSVIILVLFILASVNSVLVNNAKQALYNSARNLVRNSWENMGEKNPHSAAHYGHYVFKPVSALQLFDNGITPFTGAVLRLEAHAQNEAAFSPAQDRSEMSRFGELSISFLLQALFPLFIIVLCFGTVTQERESQNLRMLLSHGQNMWYWLAGKMTAYLLIMGSLLITGLALHLVLIKLLSTVRFTADDMTRLLIWTLFHFGYCFAWIGLSVCISSISKTGRNALLILLLLWVSWVILLPRITSNAGVRLNPGIQRQAFNEALYKDRKKGIDGHNPQDERRKHFEDSLLQQYRSASLDSLPVNADGLIMQADEEYANLVYDKHFSSLRKQMNDQNKISKISALINPFQCIRNLSMTFCNTGSAQHAQFLTSAEAYRRDLIKTLNNKMAYGGSKTGDWDWTVNAGFWKSVDDFKYQPPSFEKSWNNSLADIGVLAGWVLLPMIGLLLTGYKLKAY